MPKKCHQCGLVNWEFEEFCKRCSASLSGEAPPAHRWFVAYCVVMALLYLVIAAMGIVFLVIEPPPDEDPVEVKIMGAVFLVMGLVFCVPYGATPFLPRKSWVWVVGIVLICLGLTSACCLPVCIPLLIYWLKPEMKAFYGRDLVTSSAPPPPPPQWN